MRLGALQAVLVSVVIPALVFAQTGTSKNPSAASESLSKAADCGFEDFRLFKDDPQKVMLHLVTSWIPGEKRQGMLRYKMVVFVPKPSSDDPSKVSSTPDEAHSEILGRVSRCSISLQLHDKDDFVLRAHVMPFANVVNESAQLTSLRANDALQMSAQEYRQFLNGGSWTISWSCGFNP